VATVFPAFSKFPVDAARKIFVYNGVFLCYNLKHRRQVGIPAHCYFTYFYVGVLFLKGDSGLLGFQTVALFVLPFWHF